MKEDTIYSIPNTIKPKISGFVTGGNTYCFYIHGEIYMTIGPDWGFNLCISLIILGALLFFFLIMAPQVEPGMQFLGFSIFALALLSYLFTALKNPGIIRNDWEIEMEEGSAEKNICNLCSVIQEEGSEHCSDCQVCVRGYDHHCPLSGKCIGSGNIIPFYLFLVSVFLSIAYFALWFFLVTKELANK